MLLEVSTLHVGLIQVYGHVESGVGVEPAQPGLIQERRVGFPPIRACHIHWFHLRPPILPGKNGCHVVGVRYLSSRSLMP